MLLLLFPASSHDSRLHPTLPIVSSTFLPSPFLFLVSIIVLFFPSPVQDLFVSGPVSLTLPVLKALHWQYLFVSKHLTSAQWMGSPVPWDRIRMPRVPLPRIFFRDFLVAPPQCMNINHCEIYRGKQWWREMETATPFLRSVCPHVQPLNEFVRSSLHKELPMDALDTPASRCFVIFFDSFFSSDKCFGAIFCLSSRSMGVRVCTNLRKCACMCVCMRVCMYASENVCAFLCASVYLLECMCVWMTM